LKHQSNSPLLKASAAVVGVLANNISLFIDLWKQSLIVVFNFWLSLKAALFFFQPFVLKQNPPSQKLRWAGVSQKFKADSKGLFI